MGSDAATTFSQNHSRSYNRHLHSWPVIIKLACYSHQQFRVAKGEELLCLCLLLMQAWVEHLDLLGTSCSCWSSQEGVHIVLHSPLHQNRCCPELSCCRWMLCWSTCSVSSWPTHREEAGPFVSTSPAPTLCGGHSVVCCARHPRVQDKAVCHHSRGCIPRTPCCSFKQDHSYVNTVVNKEDTINQHCGLAIFKLHKV